MRREGRKKGGEKEGKAEEEKEGRSGRGLMCIQITLLSHFGNLVEIQFSDLYSSKGWCVTSALAPYGTHSDTMSNSHCVPVPTRFKCRDLN